MTKRRLVRQWCDKKPFTRRVRWYADENDPNTNIKLEFEDCYGLRIRYYFSPEIAKEEWNLFRNDSICTICGSVQHTSTTHYRDIICNRQMIRKR